MASTPSPSSPKLASFIRGTQTPNDIQKKLRMKKYKSMEDIMARARYVVVEKEDYSNTMCEQCGSGDNPEELLLCDRCDNGFHIKCVRPIVVRIPIGLWICLKCSGTKKVTGRRLINSLHFGNCFFLFNQFLNYDYECYIVFLSFNVFQSSLKRKF
jgi:ribosomal protein L37AE/L43A